jgi:hypothetical protein
MKQTIEVKRTLIDTYYVDATEELSLDQLNELDFFTSREVHPAEVIKRIIVSDFPVVVNGVNNEFVNGAVVVQDPDGSIVTTCRWDLALARNYE